MNQDKNLFLQGIFLKIKAPINNSFNNEYEITGTDRENLFRRS